jgi:hypothetical protein
LKPQILGLIMEHFSTNRPVILAEGTEGAGGAAAGSSPRSLRRTSTNAGWPI